MSIEYGKRITEETFVAGMLHSKKVWEQHSTHVTNPISLQTELTTAGHLITMGKTKEVDIKLIGDPFSKSPLRVEKKWRLMDETT